MTAAVHRTTQPSLNPPQTQNTAPVLEFACLYTHDIRRKQKRWQDGLLRFHTFNKRIMVYDVPRNFIGDTHWKAEEAVQDGDEVTLEREGVLVQVAESVGRTETDLTELVGKRRGRKGGSSEAGSSPMKGGQTPLACRTGSSTTGAQRQGTQLKHRSLNALLGTPKGPIGKASLPTKSPFEERHANTENEEWEDGRPPKRRRVDPSDGRNVTRKTETPAKGLVKKTPLWARTADPTKQKEEKAAVSVARQQLGTKEVIELSDDGEEPDKFLLSFSSDALVQPSSPPKDKPSTTKNHAPQPPMRSSSPAFQTQKVANRTDSGQRQRSENAPRRADTTTTGTRDTGESSILGIRSDCEKFHPPDAAALGTAEESWNFSKIEPMTESIDTANAPRPSSSRTGQTLRMASRSSKKKTLLCQDQLTKKKPSGLDSTDTEIAGRSLLAATSKEAGNPRAEDTTQRKLLEKRLARIRTRSAPAEEQSPKNGADVDDGSKAPERPLRVPSEPPRRNAKGERMTLAELDQMIMPTGRSEAQANAPPPMAPPPNQDRPLRKVASDVPPSGPQKRAPGAPMRVTLSPSKLARKTPIGSRNESNQPRSEEAPPVQPQKTRQKKPLQHSVTLNTASDGTSQVIFSKPFKTPQAAALKAEEAPVLQKDRRPDPWSREAFDLFSWRPPGWDEEAWCSTAAQG